MKTQRRELKDRAIHCGLSALFASFTALVWSTVAQTAHGELPPPEVTYSMLHSFQGTGLTPPSPLISDGNGNLYGTFARREPDGGSVFAVGADGEGFRILHQFTGGEADGFWSQAALVLDTSGVLYGTTSEGGTSNLGVVFALRVDGSGFKVLHSFINDDDGRLPYAALTLDGHGNLFGTTPDGGTGGYGTVFTLRADGSGFRVLHSFTDQAGDGSGPGALLLDGMGSLYGTTAAGGDTSLPYFNGSGTVFRMRTDGTLFQVLHVFQGPDGEYPNGALVMDGVGALYGTTSRGGTSDAGTVFTIGAGLSGFKVLHSFAGGPSDGANPVGSLVLDQSGNLYGMTGQSVWQTTDSDVPVTLFKIRTDVTGYQVLHRFDARLDGYGPSGSLTLLGSGTLCGTLAVNPLLNAATVFRVNTDGSHLQVVHAFERFDGWGPLGPLIADGAGTLYGTTTYGGPFSFGTVFRIQPDGTGFQLLHFFRDGDPDDGSNPSALVLDGSGNLFGTTLGGGANGLGTVFTLKSDGTGFRLLHSFVSGDGYGPGAALVLDGLGNLYGTTYSGGPSDAGTIFRLRTDGSGFDLLYAFPSPMSLVGSPYPSPPLLLFGSGNLYGIAFTDSARFGEVFRLGTDGTGFTLLHSFTDGPNDGATPTGSLLTDGRGILYGTTSGGGLGSGTVFRLGMDGTGFQILHAFDANGAEGNSPTAALDDSGNIYGTTAGLLSSFFTVRTDGTGFQILYNFADEPTFGQSPQQALLIAGPGVFFGTSSTRSGTIFALSLRIPHVTQGPFAPVRKHIR
jgi:uncharacterized repeat protein (TIGR03803 family)